MPPSGRVISLVVPVNNGGDGFVKCMRSILEASPPPGEIIIVVDGGEDDSWADAEKPGVRVIREKVCGGPAKARNRGAREATGDIILFVDADVTVPPDLFRRVAEVFERESELAAVIGSYDDEPAATDFFSLYKNLFHHFTHQNGDRRASTFWGACGAIRREVFIAIGGFDESYRKPSVEDIQLGYRLSAAGHRIRLEKSLQVKHLKQWGLVSLLKTEFFSRALPWSELILRERLFINDLNLRISSRISVLATFGMVVTAVGALFHPRLIALSGGLLLIVLLLNVRLLCFFFRKEGLWFGIRAMAWHCFYFFYSGSAFAVAVGRLLLHRR